MKSKNRLIINALPAEYFEKAKIPDSFNLDYNKAKTDQLLGDILELKWEINDKKFF